MFNFKNYTHLSFDSYGTLIDWESGILSCLKPILESHDLSIKDDEILRLYAKFEALEEAGEYKTYHNVLRNVMFMMGKEFGFNSSKSEKNAFPESIGNWRPFPDTINFLHEAKKRYTLVIISNIDDAIFRKTARLLQVEFDDIITAQQAGSYKPSQNNFKYAIQKLGIDKSNLLHIAQSVYHDHMPAKKLGISSVRVNRKSICPGTGIAPPAQATADVDVPDLQTLGEIMGL